MGIFSSLENFWLLNLKPHLFPLTHKFTFVPKLSGFDEIAKKGREYGNRKMGDGSSNWGNLK